MEWSVIGEIIGYIGTFLGGGWLLNFYNAKPKKNGIEIENMQAVLKSQGEEIARLVKRLDTSDERIVLLEKRLDTKHEVIFSAYGCKMVQVPENDCVVIKNWHKKCEDCINGEAVHNECEL